MCGNDGERTGIFCKSKGWSSLVCVLSLQKISIIIHPACVVNAHAYSMPLLYFSSQYFKTIYCSEKCIQIIFEYRKQELIPHNLTMPQMNKMYQNKKKGIVLLSHSWKRYQRNIRLFPSNNAAHYKVCRNNIKTLIWRSTFIQMASCLHEWQTKKDCIDDMNKTHFPHLFPLFPADITLHTYQL